MEKSTATHGDLGKGDVEHQEYLHDHDIASGDKDISREEAMHFAVLTEDELLVEKKLTRKIDLLIMPLVILVYLMNYIDRLVFRGDIST